MANGRDNSEANLLKDHMFSYMLDLLWDGFTSLVQCPGKMRE